MLQFFKYVLATIAGLFVFCFLSLLLLGFVGSALSSSSTSTEVKANSVLELNLNRTIVENAPKDDTFEIIIQSGASRVGLVDIKNALANAAEDPNIKGIYLKAESPDAGIATLSEIRGALVKFKESSKFIYSYAETMTEGGVYLNSVADKIYMPEVGDIELNGLSAQVTFMKGLFDKIGVKPEIFRVGEYKSAIEPYIRKDMSPENREQISSYVNSVADEIYGELAKSRGMSREKLDVIINNTITSIEEAKQKNIITNVGYYDEFEAALQKELGLKKDAKISFISLSKYITAKKYVNKGDRNNRIAVIVGEGTIYSGEGDSQSIGSSSWIKELRKAVKDKKVKAIVLRINSGGGSALASDLMWREIELAKKEKPVYASMGDYAASGGYYMAMACDTIVANPTTITGSIGIFGMLFNAQDLLNNKLGITFDGVETHEHSDFPSMVSEMSQPEKNMIQNMVNQGYERFTSKAAAGRKMEINKLKSLAGGRVWTGAQAKENGLVDVLGTLEDAVDLAAKCVGIQDEYQVKYYPTPKSEFELIVEKITGETSINFKEKLGILAPVVKEVHDLSRMERIQARIPYELRFE
jgi:protease-4